MVRPIIETGRASDRLEAGVRGGVRLRSRARAGGRYHVVCRDRLGNVKWVEDFTNIVVNAGLDYLLDAGLDGGTQITTWYLGLKGTGTPVAADTMSSHASWTEDQNYDESVRQTWTGGTVSSQSIDNSAAKASFAMNATTTIHGAFLTSISTKGGTTGTLYSAGDFSSSRAVESGDTLEVTSTYTMADDGV